MNLMNKIQALIRKGAITLQAKKHYIVMILDISCQPLTSVMKFRKERKRERISYASVAWRCLVLYYYYYYYYYYCYLKQQIHVIIQSKDSCLLDNLKIKINKIIIFASCDIRMWNMVSYIKGGVQANGIWKQDPEANIWAQEGWGWGLDNEELYSLYRSPNVVRVIISRRLRWAGHVARME